MAELERERSRDVALGFAVHTGWAALVAVSGTLLAPHVELRDEVALIDKKRAFVFHLAAGHPIGAEGRPTPYEKIDLSRAGRFVESAASEAARDATAAVERAIAALRATGLEVVACAVVASAGESTMPLADVLRAHPRLHTAEGHLYRDALRAGAKAHRLVARVFPPKTLLTTAAHAFGEAPGRVQTRLLQAGKVVGKPWAKDQKLAALAAWIMLSAAPSSSPRDSRRGGARA